MDIKYRSAILDDLPTLYEFEQGIVTAERPYDPTLKQGQINYYDLKAFIESSDVEVLVAEINSEIVGSGYVKIVEAKPYLKFERYGYIGFMFVKPEFRRKGISQMLIKHLRSWAESRELKELRLDVYNDNHIAVAAYENIGLKKHMVEMRIEI